MKTEEGQAGVLLMSFGAVESVDDVEAYYTNIRHGSRPTPEQVADLRARYERIGGRSPLLEIMRRQATLLELAFARHGHEVPVRVGMKFWGPFIEDGLRELVEAGARRIVAFTSGPYDSRLSVSSYERLLLQARGRVDPSVQVDLVRQWYDRPELEVAWRERFEAALDRCGWSRHDVHVVFSAHSLPERLLASHDSYPVQFFGHGRDYAARWKLPHWGYSYQSAGLTREPWLGPDISSTLDYLKESGARRVVNVPIGFVADHLEILHDLDLEAGRKAQQVGLGWVRAASLNDSPHLVEMYRAATETRLALSGAPWAPTFLPI